MITNALKNSQKIFLHLRLYNWNRYPIYRRRDIGILYPLNGRTNSLQVDNRWVVPHNPYLSLKYNSHINVEFCASITSVKYLFKYIYKGHVQIYRSVEEKTNKDKWKWFGMKSSSLWTQDTLALPKHVGEYSSIHCVLEPTPWLD
jgi:hypothetical protein